MRSRCMFNLNGKLEIFIFFHESYGLSLSPVFHAVAFWLNVKNLFKSTEGLAFTWWSSGLEAEVDTCPLEL